MNDGPTTQPSLLIRIRNTSDQAAWTQFVDVYAPLIHRFACRKGIQAADASDVTQEVLRQVASNIGGFEYDASKGRFRAWLYTTTRNQVINLGKKLQRVQGSGNSGIHGLLDGVADDSDAEAWERDYRHRLFEYAVSKVSSEFSDKTWSAFQLTAVEGIRASEAAERLNISKGAVYVAKSRVIARLREVVQQISDRGEVFLASPES